ncbi:helix-turn-helix domain-containing protein [Staphylococcus agnetis]|uniref:helix-turn-helix domain-containing protein n=1 Tax=Staphylococcus agnetis TaxID=985762 RepID=UPI000D1BF1C0|nr:XRE family transcriptional regulator [Staphylococcus agnetis]NJH67390.1 helix-turn-helix domain-containing protein [Staphylococcus agnetis]NJH86907.1 helix-turn-helix domain-containing protein [Staphylococcus agnetis]NJI15445.1 helix-turn-helix domain-containing protein [Staphylococcus agnetis]PTH38797.1 peptidase S24 [Staphylococcus agnetis]PTH64980.1 peptidase S24 [Staphylococcus agnetis]
MTSFSSNLERLMNRKDMSDSDLAALVDVNRTTVTRWRKGIRSPKLDKLPEIANVFGVEPLDLISESNNQDIIVKINDVSSQLTPPRQQNVLNYAHDQLEEQNSKGDNVVDINSYKQDKIEVNVNGCVSAGVGERLHEETLFTEMVKAPVPPHDLALKVNGDSMEPMFKDGEIIFVEKTHNIKNGQIGIFIIEEEAYLKKVIVEDDRLTLISLNKNYKDLHFYENQSVKLVGKVIL